MLRRPGPRFWFGLLLVALLASAAWKEAPRELARWCAALARDAELDGDTPRRLQWLTRAVTWAPESPHWHLKRAEAWQTLGKYKLAAQDLSAAEQHGAPPGLLYQYRATLWLHQGQPKKALAEWKKLWQLHRRQAGPLPEHGTLTWSELAMLNGLAYHRALAGEELPQALEDARRVVFLRDDVRLRAAADAYLALCAAKTLAEVNDSSGALHHVSRAIAILRKKIHQYQRRATAVRQFAPDRYAEELKQLRQMLVAAYVEQYAVYKKLRLPKAADKAADFVERLNGDLDADGWGIDLDGGIRSAMDLGQFLDTLAMVEYAMNDAQAAVRDAEAALRVMAELPAAFEIRVSVRARQRVDVRRWVRRQDDLRQVLAVLYYHRGLARAKAGRQEEAEDDFDQVRELGFEPGPGLF